MYLYRPLCSLLPRPVLPLHYSDPQSPLLSFPDLYARCVHRWPADHLSLGGTAREMEMRSATTATTTVCCLLCLVAQLLDGATVTSGNPDGELWGYTEVRPKAHCFWWYYKSPQRASSPGKPWPTILWMQGGPGGSSVGRGNFQEIGPLDVDLKPRNTTWLQKADLIFVDSPVGVGYSYVEDSSALAKSDLQASMDVVELIKVLVKEIPTLQSSPLYLVGESYGGKLAAIIGVSVARSIRAGSLNLTLGGVVLGNSWISPDDFALSYPGLLHSMSRLDDNAVATAIAMGIRAKQQVAAEQFTTAYNTWADLMNWINARSGQVNMENIMTDNTLSPIPPNGIMNGVIKKKLIIIPMNLTFQDVSSSVFDELNNDFMRPAIKEVDELLMYGVNVTVYNGQLDLICSTVGAESWLKKLKWDGLNEFLRLPRRTLSYCHPYDHADVFVRSYRNLAFYWVLGAGHNVPVDQPCAAMHTIGDIVKSPAGTV